MRPASSKNLKFIQRAMHRTHLTGISFTHIPTARQYNTVAGRGFLRTYLSCRRSTGSGHCTGNVKRQICYEASEPDVEFRQSTAVSSECDFSPLIQFTDKNSIDVAQPEETDLCG